MQRIIVCCSTSWKWNIWQMAFLSHRLDSRQSGPIILRFFWCFVRNRGHSMWTPWAPGLKKKNRTGLWLGQGILLAFLVDDLVVPWPLFPKVYTLLPMIISIDFLHKIKEERILVILVASSWPIRTWYTESWWTSQTSCHRALCSTLLLSRWV